MEPKNSKRENSLVMDYVLSLRHPVKRRYGMEYMTWVRAGRTGSAPSRGRLSPTLARVVCINVDALV